MTPTPHQINHTPATSLPEPAGTVTDHLGSIEWSAFPVRWPCNIYTADQVTEILAAERAKLKIQQEQSQYFHDLFHFTVGERDTLKALLIQAQTALTAAKNVLGKLQPDSDGVQAYVMAQDVIKAIDKVKP